MRSVYQILGLKTRYQGILLTAVAADVNGKLFSVAYAVVDAENDDNWLWMLKLLHQVVEKIAPDFLEGKVFQFSSSTY